MNEFKNTVQLMGNIGAAPEIKTTSTGRKYAKFSLAVDNNYKNKEGEWAKSTSWHRMVAWGKIAERVERALDKGYMIVVSGELNSRVYEDQEGKKRYVSEVVVNPAIKLSGNNDHIS